MERRCLNCGNDFEAKRDSAKYCSDNCRVKWNYKNGKNKQVTKFELKVLYNEIMDLAQKINSGQNVKTPIPNTLEKFVNTEEKKAVTITTRLNGQTEKSFQQFMNEIADLQFEAEYKVIADEIEASTLTTKQKNLLYINMRTSKL